MADSMTRRALLARAGIIGCSMAASPLMTPISLAGAPTENRLVVIILRGAMDGLDILRPYGDPNYSGLRPTLGGGPEIGAHDLDGFFALHPAMEALLPLWHAKELAFAPATSTPYRDKRSHFDGQDLLEAGTIDLSGAIRERNGWLNRMLTLWPDLQSETAFSIGIEDMLVLRGTAEVANWAPNAKFAMSPQAKRLIDLIMHDDPQFLNAYQEATRLMADDVAFANRVASMGGDDSMDMTGAMQQVLNPKRTVNASVQVAEYAAQRLRGDTRIAAFSLGGWDTHQGQKGATSRAVQRLADTLLTLKRDLGKAWNKTMVLAMTEFGRTARENGTRGTDHGTGGALVLAGGALRGGRMIGEWPGLSEADLYNRRDLMPVRDVRAYAAWAMRSQFGVSQNDLETTVFPGLDMQGDPKLL